MDEDWRHGMWQGELKVQRLAWDLGDPTVRGGIFGLFENKARVTASGPAASSRAGACSSSPASAPTPARGFAGWEDIGLSPARLRRSDPAAAGSP